MNEKEYNIRRNIENNSTCPRCLASEGQSCSTNGLTDHPHPERLEVMYRQYLLKIRQNFFTHSLAYELIDARLKRGLVRSSHSESTTLFIDTKATTIDVENYRKKFQPSDAEALIEYALACKYPDQYIEKYSSSVQGIFDTQHEFTYAKTSKTKNQIERIADAADSLNLYEAYTHCANKVWRVPLNKKNLDKNDTTYTVVPYEK